MAGGVGSVSSSTYLYAVRNIFSSYKLCPGTTTWRWYIICIMMIAAANTGNHRQDRALVTPHENTFNEKAGGDNDDINCKLSEKVFIVYRVDRRRMVGWCSHACLLIRSHLPPHHSSVTTVSPSLTNYTVIRSSFLSSPSR